MVDPLSLATTLLSTINYLYDVVEKTKDNKEECKRLVDHARIVHTLIQSRCKEGIPKDLESRLEALSCTLSGISTTLEELAQKPYLKRLLWSGEVSSRISKAYQVLHDAIQVFNIGSQIDMQIFQQEHQAARDVDTEQSRASFEKVLHSDREILTMLEIHKTDMQDAIMTILKHITELPESIERRFLERGMHAMQSRSGKMKYKLDDYLITSLDIIIYEDRKLGTGGFGEVFEGDWLGSAVAVKVLDKNVPEWMIMQEIQAWKRLKHPHILQFYGACLSARQPFLVCTLMKNGDALRYIREHPEQVNRRKLLYEAALGLVHLHDNSVVHGDLKATNILIDDFGRACISDFGLSQIKTHTTTVRKASKITSTFTKPDPLIGTARWMAPEQFSLGVVNKMTDVYSFGMTMYEIFTGHPPFANTLDSLLFNIVVDRGLRPSRPEASIVPSMDDITWALIERAWSQDPKDRPQVQDVAAELKAPTLSSRISIAGDNAPIHQTSEPLTPARNSNQIWLLEKEFSNLFLSSSPDPTLAALTHNDSIFPWQRYSGTGQGNICQSPDSALHSVSSLSIRSDITDDQGIPSYDLAFILQPTRSPVSGSLQFAHNMPERPRVPWDRIHQYLLQLASKHWSQVDLHLALQSCFGAVDRSVHILPDSVNETALSIYVLQVYRRYVQLKMQKAPRPLLDTFVIPPHTTGEINDCLRNGMPSGIGKGDVKRAADVLRKWWKVIGQQTMPKVLIVFGRHWSSETSWIVQKFNLVNCSLTMYEVYNRWSIAVISESVLPYHPGWWDVIRQTWSMASPYRETTSLSHSIPCPQDVPSHIPLAAAIIWLNTLIPSTRSLGTLDRKCIRNWVREEVAEVLERKEDGHLDYRYT